jgi:hypothetical protein
MSFLKTSAVSLATYRHRKAESSSKKNCAHLKVRITTKNRAEQNWKHSPVCA